MMLKVAFSFLVGFAAFASGLPLKAATVCADMRLENVRTEADGIRRLFSNLAFEYDIPIGLEIARGGDKRDFYQIDFKKGTLSELMSAFVGEHEEYAWKIENGVLSIFPKKDHREVVLRELLRTEIDSFSVAPRTVTGNFEQNLVGLPETRRVLEHYDVTFDNSTMGSFYFPQLGRQFSFTISNAKLKAILDKAIKESPVARFWTISYDQSEQTVSVRVAAKFEHDPKDRQPEMKFPPDILMDLP